MQPFRHLLKPKTPFKWTIEPSAIFKDSKSVIIEEMKEGVRLFHLSRPTCLVTEWSTTGIGFRLMQKYCAGHTRIPTCCKRGWKLCLVGSRFTHGSETRYAPVEGEAVTVVYTLHQTHHYIRGCTYLTVATDHRLLIGLLNDRSLTEIDNRRLLNLKENSLNYSFKIIHVSGKKNAGADAVSRNPLNSYPASDKKPPYSQTYDFVKDRGMLTSISDSLYTVTNVVTWDVVREATTSDAVLQSLH